MTTLDELEKLASEAKRVGPSCGTWYSSKEIISQDCPVFLIEDAEFIAAANPATILAILEDYKVMKEIVQSVADIPTDTIGDTPTCTCVVCRARQTLEGLRVK